jgi:DNA-directed RNA polymerase sigma subunit (sigma70/sigma32)
MMGISRERVRQIKDAALASLRRSAHGKALAQYTE